ncbi:MAG: hypothetical protein UU48_C0002G0113 [Candidatus Uhrbacteria bacterium GW2011_GWF2_41_16]|uniref:YprB ribonuclease H-like domain-containing protein n=2 Tax=Candidatus Uhriibacteriota TaxID=1752732 RepID=A0A0G0VCB5_9BACT|nr:MAG: hypothetical protein UU31_C0003G0122 [Candidatus Uhrbacteria bacterium GW2011_GWA2_41_10]KKR87598.1 MAG: hypothetical protein UU35_C0002G0099 [Candidatus Uhrbacteria bacterium GW2011_GWC2_41_11]KKR98578.1 MAG: hypothetical protein UU48_C0002G0113 [Candidatus Uhrbacteria bacterium GW2011_GWF2_41_16]
MFFMPRKITEKTFFQYLKCPSWVYYDATQSEPVRDALLLRLMDDGLIFEKEYEIIRDRPDVVEVMAEDPEEAFRQTVTFMREGRETIYRATLVDGHWVGTPDFLARVEGHSTFGSYYYVAADMKRTREVRDDYKFQGCFYAELLERIQGHKPVQGYVVTPEKKTMSYLIEEFEKEYKLTLQEIERIVAGEKPAHFLTSGCKQSPWFSTCRKDSESCNDLSILNRIWTEEVHALSRADITNVDAFAALSMKDIERRRPNITHSRLEMLHKQAVALTQKQHIILESPIFPEAKTELYFDIESDPLRDLDFLFGVLEVKRGRAKYHSFLASKPEDEGKMWHEFCDFMQGFLDVPVYHYGWYEADVVQRLGAKYGISELLRESFEHNFIDLLSMIRPSVIFPLSFYSLKDLAAYAGYKWHGEEPSGVNAVLWFEVWLKMQDQTYLDRILTYNEDDVRATWTLKKWVEKNAV